MFNAISSAEMHRRAGQGILCIVGRLTVGGAAVFADICSSVFGKAEEGGLIVKHIFAFGV